MATGRIDVYHSLEPLSLSLLDTLAQPRSFVFISHVYPPDPAAVGQQIEDAAVELARRGHRVSVLTADRGYDDPNEHFSPRESRRGVSVIRLPWSSFGKGSMLVRLLGGVSFLFQATLRALLMRGVDRVVITTAPLTSPIAGALLATVRRLSVMYWVMDLNPDQLVALGVVRRGALLVRILDWFNIALLRRAFAVVVCDRYMANLVRAKFDPGNRLHVVPPWAHEQYLEPVARDTNPFRQAHGLTEKRVVMYSGNHALTNPLTALLKAAERLRDDDRLAFVFVGGGVGKQHVEALRTPNVVSLPYQPLDQIRYSLSAADVHVVTIGDDVVGIVHPCKIYGALAVGRPILSFGPDDSHLGDIARRGVGWHLQAADIDGAVQVLEQIATMPLERLEATGRQALRLFQQEFESTALRRRVCDIIAGADHA